MEFLVLEVDDARFGIPTGSVREVVRAVSLEAAPTRLPNMIGLLNYRGQVLGVMELACLRGQAHRALTPNEHLIILQTDGQLFALRVDQAVEIITWADGDSQAGPPGSGAATTDEALHAMTHSRLGVVHMLDAGALWAEMHEADVHLEAGNQPQQEVEAH